MTFSIEWRAPETLGLSLDALQAWLADLGPVAVVDLETTGLPDSRNAEILALWILAKTDLNRVDRYRNTLSELLWSFRQRNPPIASYTIGGQKLRSFQHVKRSARHF